MRDSCSRRTDSKAVNRSPGLSLYGQTTLEPKDREETYGLLNSAGEPRVNSISRKHNSSSSIKTFQKLPNCFDEHPIGWLPMPSLEQTLPELATASMYWPLMTSSCLGKTKPSIRGAGGTDGSCVNPPWTHQSFQSLWDLFFCYSFHKTFNSRLDDCLVLILQVHCM